MKKAKYAILTLLLMAFISCGARKSGTAYDRTGNNGATNGTGKVARDK